MNLATLVKAAPKAIKSFAAKRGPEILLAVGISSSLASVIFAVKATPKALKAIDAKKEEIIKEYDLDENPEDLVLRPTDTIKAAWKYYIPSAVLFLCSVACLISGNRVSAKRNAAIAAACTIAEETARQYKEALAEVAEPEIKEKIEEKVAEKKLEAHDSSKDPIYIPEDSDKELCYDPWSDKIFRTTKNELDAAINTINADMLKDVYSGTACLNDFYDLLSDPTMGNTKSGDILGWSVDKDMPVKIKLDAKVKDGKPVLLLSFEPPPVRDLRLS